MNRAINTHKVNGLNEAISVVALDGPGAGGASHEYQVLWRNGNPKTPADFFTINFQKGPVKENFPNGASNEALLAIVIDRLQGFQSGDFKCRENAIALTKLEEAMHWLLHRTRERTQRGVEGTSQK